MKECPKCGQTFNDDSLGFCLLDGTALVMPESQPTVVIERVVATPKKKNTGLWVGLIIVVMLFGIIAVAGILMLLFSNRGDTANANNRNGVNVSPSPKPSTPKPAPSSTAALPTPTVDMSNPTAKIDESDEIIPISWTTAAATFKTDSGLTYKFQCPENGTPGAVWGSDVYTADSSICTAAVHAGIIALDRGGVVTVEFRPGRAAYGSTVRNGITSSNYGEYPHSFVVR
ncbi:MAG: LCCL domain-containing protein [Acidobacteriota bacterium]